MAEFDFNAVPRAPSSISLSDLEDTFIDATGPLKMDGEAYNYGHIPGSFMNTDRLRELSKLVIDTTMKQAGHGGSSNILQNFLSRIDRLGTAIVPTNNMHAGYTFITRPRLNLTGANLHQLSTLTTLHNSNEKSVAFMIRALLDTRLSRGDPLILGSITPEETLTPEVTEFAESAAKSPLFDACNPFFVPLMNGLVGISGFPDFTLDTETTAGDFFGGDFTFAKGSDFMGRTQELSLEFRDVQGSIVLSCIYYWCLIMAAQARGIVMAYPDDIYERRLNYTVSIYRFITDKSRGQILWWAKATGCFPKSVPVGALFNISQNETEVSSAKNFSIPFTVNNVSVNDVGTLFDFNQLVERYQDRINDETMFKSIDRYDTTNNFSALPYIVSKENSGIWMDWRTSSDYYSLANETSTDQQKDTNQLFIDAMTAAQNEKQSEIDAAVDILVGEPD